MAENDLHGHYSINNCRIITMNSMEGDYGTLTVAENRLLPFEVRRAYYLYDIPTGSHRGGHSHCTEHRLIAAITGCFDVEVDDGEHTKVFTLRTPFEGLYIPPGIWRTLYGFSSGSVVLGLCSAEFSELDYVRDHDLFLSKVACRRNEKI
ncbi:MAG: WxcM-like domain-containing protein [Bacteroides sp.]|nr:WxcM-like domain-containing protein [Bacteroides sp.]